MVNNIKWIYTKNKDKQKYNNTFSNKYSNMAQKAGLSIAGFHGKSGHVELTGKI